MGKSSLFCTATCRACLPKSVPPAAWRRWSFGGTASGCGRAQLWADGDLGGSWLKGRLLPAAVREVGLPKVAMHWDAGLLREGSVCPVTGLGVSRGVSSRLVSENGPRCACDDRGCRFHASDDSDTVLVWG